MVGALGNLEPMVGILGFARGGAVSRGRDSSVRLCYGSLVRPFSIEDLLVQVSPALA